jgi:hypothetical protein
MERPQFDAGAREFRFRFRPGSASPQSAHAGRCGPTRLFPKADIGLAFPPGDDDANRVSTDARRLISDDADSANAAPTAHRQAGTEARTRFRRTKLTRGLWGYWLPLRISTANRIRSAVRATPSFVRNWPAVLATVL